VLGVSVEIYSQPRSVVVQLVCVRPGGLLCAGNYEIMAADSHT